MNLRPSGLVALGLAESRQSCVELAGVAIVGEMASITRATAVV